MKISLEADSIEVQRPSDIKKHKSLHGLTRTLVNNMVVGVTQGYEKLWRCPVLATVPQSPGTRLC